MIFESEVKPQGNRARAPGKPQARTQHPPTNIELSEKLHTVAELLLVQGADRFRASAYQRAADHIAGMEEPVWMIYAARGIEGLEQIPGVGRTISRALQQLIRGGRWPLLERLQGNDIVEKAFATVPNVGLKLAKRIHDELGIESLAELQAAAWDGRLAKLEGFGHKRIQAVRESLDARGRLLELPRSDTPPAGIDQQDLTSLVPVSEILDVDDEYRFKSSQDQLPRVAPRRNNPAARAWLPILHTSRANRHYTALFSNTERAHAMGTTHDWVVIYLEDHHHDRGQHGRWTVITSRFGKLRGKRIVRGREEECATYYHDRL